MTVTPSGLLLLWYFLAVGYSWFRSKSYDAPFVDFMFTVVTVSLSLALSVMVLTGNDVYAIYALYAGLVVYEGLLAREWR